MENRFQTYLYIKQHSVTGMLYFGKTIANPEKYNGSGRYWIDHIKKHGKQFIETLWYCLFLESEECYKFALEFSIKNNIIESKNWANLVYEDGLDGGNLGKHHSDESIKKMSESLKGRIFTEEHKRNLSLSTSGAKHYLYGKSPSKETITKMSEATSGENNPMFGKFHSQKSRKKMSDSHIGIPKPQQVVTCPHCGKEGGQSLMTRWHFDNCKFKINPSLLLS